MANKKLFRSQKWSMPEADTVNEAGGKAYSLSTEQALAQYVCTGCLNGTFYAKAEEQLDYVKEAVSKVSDEFLAALAVYGRQKGGMKDMPALILALLSAKKQGNATALFNRIFPLVVDNGKMLRTFVQIIRSGQTGRKSFGTSVKRAINKYLTTRRPGQFLTASVGEAPSLSDVIKMTHPRFGDGELNEMAKREMGRDYDFNRLPELVQEYERFIKALAAGEASDMTPPNVDFRLLSAHKLTKEHWKRIALDGCESKRVQMILTNLNTFMRHGALDKEVAAKISEMLHDREAIVGTPERPSRLFPYKLWTAYHFATDIPTTVKRGLAAAIDMSLENVPEFDGNIVVAPDVSGSMSQPITGYRGTATTSVLCRHVAALISCVFLKKNPDNTTIMPFADRLFLDVAKFDPLDTVATNTEKLNRLPGGGTDVSLPLVEINRRGLKPDLVVYVSDMQSWLDSSGSSGSPWYRTTSSFAQWDKLKKRNPKAKVAWINLVPYGTVQMPNRADALNIGGFSDSVFEAMNSFFISKDPNHWVKVIKEFWKK